MNDNGNWTIEDVRNLNENELTYSKFEELYKPKSNHISPYGDKHYETYGEEYEYIKTLDPKYVWTEVQGDMSLILVTGVAFVNRLSYTVCENPWTDEWQTVVLSMDIECECFNQARYDEGEDAGDPECEYCEGYGLRSVDPEDYLEEKND